MTRERSPGVLMNLHVEALYTHDAAGRIVRVREHDGAPAPRFFLGHAADGSAVRRFRADVGDALRRALEAAADDAPSPDSGTDPAYAAAAELARYAALLGRDAPVERTWAGPAFRFPDALPAPYAGPDLEVVLVTEANATLLHPLLPAWVPDVHRSPPLMALVVEGRAVAVCASVRITPRARGGGRDGAGVPRSPVRAAGRGRVGAGGARVRRRAALQHVVAERGVARRRAAARAGRVRVRLAPHLIMSSTGSPTSPTRADLRTVIAGGFAALAVTAAGNAAAMVVLRARVDAPVYGTLPLTAVAAAYAAAAAWCAVRVRAGRVRSLRSPAAVWVASGLGIWLTVALTYRPGPMFWAVSAAALAS